MTDITTTMSEAEMMNAMDAMNAAYATIVCAHCGVGTHRAIGADGIAPTECETCEATPARSCWECGTSFRPAAHTDSQYCATCLAARAARAETCEALAEMAHDFYVMHRGLARALVRHGWSTHMTSDYSGRIAEIVGTALANAGLDVTRPHSLPRFAGGGTAVAALASLTLWGPAPTLAYGYSHSEDVPDFDMSGFHSAMDAESVRDSMRDAWARITEITGEMAEENSYCSEYEQTCETIQGYFRTDGMPEIEPREQDFIVTVPVTVTGYANIRVTARNAEDALELASDNGIDWSDVEIDRYSADIEPDWDGADVNSD